MLIAQISDLHLRACGRLLHGAIDTEAAVVACIDHLLRLHPRPDVVLATGDLVDPGGRGLRPAARPPRPAAHAGLAHSRQPRRPRRPRRRLRRLCLHAPRRFYPLRDRRLAVATAWPRYAATRGDGRLDLAPNGCAGSPIVSPSSRSGRRCCSCIIHPSSPGSVSSIRPSVRAEVMAAIVRQHPQVRQIVCGHLHRAVHHSWAGTTATSPPASSIR